MVKKKAGKPASKAGKPAKKAAPAKKPAAKAKGKSTGKAPAKKPASKAPATKTAMPKPADLAAFLGVKLHKRLEPATIHSLRKALPGYMTQLDDAAAALQSEEVPLGLADVTPGALREAKSKLKHLLALEEVAETVYRSIYEERLQLDDKAMGMIQKIARRVGAHSDDDPQLLVRWKFLRDYLAKYRGGRRTSDEGTDEKPEADKPPADETPAEG